MNNTVYTITPPDLRLNTNGPSTLILGVNLENSKDYTDVFDKLFPEVEVNFFVRENEIDAQTLAWYRVMSGIASSVVVDVDNITSEELLIALQAEYDNNILVYWVSLENKQSDLMSLLNSYRYQIFASATDLETYLVSEYTKND